MKMNVIIVGAGPAGSTAAYILAKSGLKVTLIDAEKFPRQKLCGGLLTLRTKRLFENIFGESISGIADFKSDGMKMYFRDKLLSSVTGYKNLYLVNRIDFDSYLLKQAKKAGVQLILGKRVCDISYNTVRLSDNTLVDYSLLIGADGVNSVVAKHLYGASFIKKQTAFCLETEIPIEFVKEEVKEPEVFFGYANWGYGWVFPKSKTVTVGIGGLPHKNKDMKEAFQQLLQDRFGITDTIGVKGFHVPAGAYRTKPGKGNIIVCGDAAGLVEPITGEGIAFAMQSGKFAAESVLETANGKGDLYNNYLRKFRKILKIMRIARFLRLFIFTNFGEKLLRREMPRSERAIKRHVDLMSDDMSYEEYLKVIMMRLIQKLLKFGR